MPAEKENYNFVQLIGNLGADPDVRYFESGSCVTECRIAVYNGKSKKTGEYNPSMWFTVKAWNSAGVELAEFRKGDRLQVVEGQLSQDSWQDRESGKTRTKDYVLAWKVAKIERQTERPNLEEPAPEDYDDLPF